AQRKAALCLSHTFLKIIKFHKIKYLTYHILMTTTCPTTEAALQAGLLPVQEPRKGRFTKSSDGLIPQYPLQ
ncbi:hypothetical protein, partial [Uruburuella suis]|uniref:hypothetical protein n=1 Tax=Uruburuella suis TaxID=252130 RepID=UPI002490C34F